MSRLLTLTTDFGTQDAYVAAMKGVILGIQPTVRMVDITHEVTPQDVMEAAYVLRGAVPFFPPETIHLVVVDPGVGTDRRPVALRHEEQWFVGPDNGLFTLLLDGSAPDELVVLDRPAYWRTPELSATFHGRDLFAPVAAHLASGRGLHEVGSPAEGLSPLHWALPIEDDEGLRGWVVHIDRFGNCMTNIPRDRFEARRRGRPIKGYAGSATFEALRPTYGAVPAGEALLLFGSGGTLEVAVNGGNASSLLGIRRGDPIHIIFQDGS